MPNIVAGHLDEKHPRSWAQRARVALDSAWGLAALIVLAAALVAALAYAVSPVATTDAESSAGPPPAVIEHPEGMSVARLTLTEQAVQRVGIQTAPVEAQAAGGSGRLTVPYGALLYDAEGKTWVYTSPEPLVYVRAAVDVDRIEGDSVLLSSGPEAGTNVVTVGAQELLGTEFEVDH